MFRGVTISFAVLLAICDSGICLQCYQCRSEANPECNGNLTSPLSQYLVDCNDQNVLKYNEFYLHQFINPILTSETGNYSVCLEMIKNDGSTARTCFPGYNLTVANQLCSRSMEIENLDLKTCRFCDQDLCNSSTTPTATILETLVALMTMFLINK